MKLEPQDLERISALTLQHYNTRAAGFFEGTRDHDVSQNIAALLEHIEGEPPSAILDFGWGPGRDLKTFAALGHVAVGLEGAAQFVDMARAYSGCEVWQQDFLRLDLPHERFDGVYANASLFHVASQELPRVLRQLHATLKPGGVLLATVPGMSQTSPHADWGERWAWGFTRVSARNLVAEAFPGGTVEVETSSLVRSTSVRDPTGSRLETYSSTTPRSPPEERVVTGAGEPAICVLQPVSATPSTAMAT